MKPREHLWQFGRQLKELIIGEVRTLWKVNCWRSPDGTVKARTIGRVQKDAAQGQKPEESWEGWPLMNFGWDYCIPNRSEPKPVAQE